MSRSNTARVPSIETLPLALGAVVLLAALGCQRPEAPPDVTPTADQAAAAGDPETPGNAAAVADTAAAGSTAARGAAAAPDEASGQPSAPNAVTAPPTAADVDGSAAGQALLAQLVGDALRDQSSAELEQALRALGRAMSEYRAGRYQASLVRAVQWFTAEEHRAVRARLDGRVVVPALELLLDVRDMAAITRLQAEFRTGPAAEMFAGALRQIESLGLPPASLDRSALDACELLVDGRPFDPDVPIRPGSHTLRCGDGPPALVELASGAHTVSGAPAALVVAPAPGPAEP